MDVRLGGFLPHVMCTALGYIFWIFPVQDGWGEAELSKPDDRRGAAMWQICNMTPLLFWDGWRFIARSGRGKKCCSFRPLPPKKCAGKLLRVPAVERQPCIRTTRWHAVTQVCSLQLLSGRQMSAVLHLIGITLAQSGNFFPQFGRHISLMTHFLDNKNGTDRPVEGAWKMVAASFVK